MTDYKRQPTGKDCPPAPKDPADQPTPPGKTTCAEWPPTTPPTLAPPDPCPDPDPDCKCPKRSPSTPNCLEDLIAKQAADIAAADKAKAFKTDLEALLTKAKAAGPDYTRDAYDKLVKQWVEQDVDLAELVRKLVCAVPCWRCIIDCYVCPLLNDLHSAEQWLYGDGTLYSDVHDLYDLLYWHGRDRDSKERRLQRVKRVLAAWEKPKQTIEKALNDIKAAIEAANKSIGTEPGKVVFDVFMRVIPLHLAIAPPGGSDWTTRIGKEYTDLCKCGDPKRDDCCGPDVGETSFAERLIGPQPYLIDPDDYFGVICCLVEKRYAPAKDAWSKADAEWIRVDAWIKRLQSQIENGLKNFDKDAKGAIPSVIDCCDYDADDDKTKQSAR